ncbi:response regulator [Brevibacterium sp.]|uniref:response regulator n=1 Tax=Brevibacterium sp. TaxID=1701 RepID=UPI002647DE41|nr:response regulator [Brevibacterium sp.]MDN5806498.1 response regulator [Brevibacterium sp.]MDN5834820.1 response regulator [Brevibacterium sp.]MDN5875938.1 response regulator [Brevibacterium sp.]MDN5910990.1 response regulator [Brevibacterium sp.]MDN6133126.1 response regulator [Brevibacterium sp.]
MSETTTPESSIGVLVVEDEAVAARAHAKYIDRIDGYHLAGVAKNATQAMAALTGKIYGLNADCINLVLLDMNLPDGHGLQVCRAIRGHRVDVDIIAVTAARDMQIVQEALSYGVAQYIIKPFTFPVFRSKLEAYSSFRNSLGGDSTEGEVTQTDVDTAIAALRTHTVTATAKGVPNAVQTEVKSVLGDNPGQSAAEVAVGLGVSRVTARRYLEAMADAGLLARRPRYGSAGRPVLEYTVVTEDA